MGGQHRVLFAADGAPDLYQLMSDLYWVPMGYGTAFIFLGVRAALGLSLVRCPTTSSRATRWCSGIPRPCR
jgi:hypothetical protein